MKKLIDLVFIDVGGGHKITAQALGQGIQDTHSCLEPRLFDLGETELVASLDIFKPIIGILGIDVYNFMLKQGWTQLEFLYLFLAKLSIRCRHQLGLQLLEKYWLLRQPDLVVSCIPLLNRVLRESLQNVLPETPFVTILTDFADCPPHYWIESQDQFLLCPTDQSVWQAQLCHYRSNQIFRLSGLAIHPKFYQPVTVNRRKERQRLGLDPDLPTGLVMFGSQGSQMMLQIAEYLAQSRLNLQVIFLCGKNTKLALSLSGRQYPFPKVVETFTPEIPYYMDLSDFLIGKPGPATITEALVRKLPVITECNWSTLLQERYNTEWITQNQVGIVLDTFGNINRAVAEVIQPQNLANYRTQVNRLNNRGIFEAVAILEDLANWDKDHEKNLARRDTIFQR